MPERTLTQGAPKRQKGLTAGEPAPVPPGIARAVNRRWALGFAVGFEARIRSATKARAA
jgi:hypothetical protein